MTSMAMSGAPGMGNLVGIQTPGGVFEQNADIGPNTVVLGQREFDTLDCQTCKVMGHLRTAR